jgi:hypothetical protein
MRYPLSRYCAAAIVFLLLSFCCARAQQTDSSKLKRIFSVTAGLQHGFVFAHSPEVENTKGARPTGVELLFGWQRNDQGVWDLCNCFPRKGLLLAYYDYDSKILGKSFTAAYFLEPAYRISRNAFFSFKAVAGLSYLTNPFDTIKNPDNRSYSTHISGYLLLGAGIWLRLSDRWWLNASANYQHESNGGIQQPNKGINWPTAGLALSYQHNPRPYYTGIRKKDKFWKEYSIRYDLGLMGIAKRVLDETGNSKRLPLFGVHFQGSKQVGRINALTAGAEIFMDRALRMQLSIDSVEASHVRAGILVGHEFLLGKFLFSQRLGVYLFDETPYFDRIYHRWGIQFRANRRWSAGFNLQAHRHVADFIDFRVAYSWQKRWK